MQKRKEKIIHKHSPAITIWEGIGIQGTTTLHIIRGSINSGTYTEILGENLLVTIGTLYPDGYELQQDNAKPHTSHCTKQWLTEHGIRVVSWPAWSPDLNIIENVWAIMKDRLEKSERRTLSEWTLEIQKIWNELGPDFLKSFFDSLPRRIEMRITANGDTIK